MWGNSSIVVDPTDEKLKREFSAWIPMYAIVRIDKAEKQGQAQILDMDGSVSPFPGSAYHNQTPNK